MRRTTLVLVTVAVIVAIALVSGGALAQERTDDEPDDESAVAPGERLSGVIGVQAAEFEGEMANRTFGVTVAQAATSNAKAEVVGQQLADVEQRIAEIEQRTAELEQARENGSVSEGAYRAKVAQLEARRAAAERLANSTNDTARGLPADVLEANGVNVTAIQRLRTHAANLTGPQVAEIARSIAGPKVGSPAVGGPGHGKPADVGPGGVGPGGAGPENRTDAGNATDVDRNGTRGGPGDVGGGSGGPGA